MHISAHPLWMALVYKDCLWQSAQPVEFSNTLRKLKALRWLCSQVCRVYSLNEFMTLDAATRRNLELTETLRGDIKGSLLGVLDQTRHSHGKTPYPSMGQPTLTGC